MIADHLAKGKCSSADKMDDVFPVTRQSNAVTIAATINGIKGRFDLDTGATCVSLKRSFVEKAEIDQATFAVALSDACDRPT